MSSGVCIIIPTYGNGTTVVDVVMRAMAQSDDVIVVCDGCKDDTLSVLDAMERKPVILRLERNRGKGAALKVGFRYALEAGYAYAITLDADGQHFPEDIPVMLEANRKYPGSLIVGERKHLGEAERCAGSRFANALSDYTFAFQTGHHLRDTQTGFRLYPLKKLKGISVIPDRYDGELMLMILASWSGVRLVSVPVNVHYPPKEKRVSHFRKVRDTVRISAMNTVLCLFAVLYGWPAGIVRYLMRVLRTFYTLFIFTFSTMFLMTPVMHIYLGIGKMTEKKERNLHRLFYSLTRFGLYRMLPGVKYSLSNPSGEDFTKPSVIICNHQSHLDLVAALSLTPNLIILTADWVWDNPFYRYTIRKAEFLPVSAGVDALMPRLKSLVGRGYSIMVYPEGTRSEDGSIGRFHQGAFHIARTLGLDILPTVIYGSGKVLPKHGRLLNKWRMHLEVDKRIPCAELAAMGSTYREMASAMRRYYVERYAAIADMMEQDV